MQAKKLQNPDAQPNFSEHKRCDRLVDPSKLSILYSYRKKGQIKRSINKLLNIND